MTRLPAYLGVARNGWLAAVNITAGRERDGLSIAQLVLALAPGLALLLFARPVLMCLGAGLLGVVRLWNAPW